MKIEMITGEYGTKPSSIGKRRKKLTSQSSKSEDTGVRLRRKVPKKTADYSLRFSTRRASLFSSHFTLLERVFSSSFLLLVYSLFFSSSASAFLLLLASVSRWNNNTSNDEGNTLNSGDENERLNDFVFSRGNSSLRQVWMLSISLALFHFSSPSLSVLSERMIVAQRYEATIIVRQHATIGDLDDHNKWVSLSVLTN